MKVKTVIVGMLHTNCYILEDEQSGKCAVIDPGANSERILKELDGKQPEIILLTHGHFDHILAAAQIKRATGAKLYIHKEDEHMLSERYVKSSGMVKSITDVATVDGFFKDGDHIELGSTTVKVMHTPGHTKGSCVLICNDVMFSGDTLFYESWGRTDFEGGDDAEMVASFKKLAMIDGDYTVLPGHGESTTLTHEKSYNTLMRYAIKQ
jgi:glyoxylase-like metal-dependent hydrolase (beta-lactamase superfamily II)